MYQLLRHNEAITANKGLACCADSFLAIGSKGDVGTARVFAAEGPFCFAVADEEQSRRCHGCCDCVDAGLLVVGGWGCAGCRVTDLMDELMTVAGGCVQDSKQLGKTRV